MKMLKSINRLWVTEWLGILGTIVILAASGFPAQAGQNVTLAWNASPDTNVVGYILYYGLVGGGATNSLDAANQLTATVSNLNPGTVEFFFATAYNAQRTESLPSNLINYTVPGTNTAPTITSISNRTVNEDTSSGAISFTVGDAETAAGSLIVSGSSSNPTLVPNGNIVFGGSGASRTVTVTPAANQSGTATITVTVSDGALTASTSFTLTVSPVNDPPTISSIANQTINVGSTPLPIAFTVGDADTALSSLTLSGSSSNPTLVPTANIVFGGSGANRTVTVTPAGSQPGTATITVTVSDGALNASSAFTVTVIVPNLSGLVAMYSFDEGTGTTVTDLSGTANTGTISGATWTTSGKYGKALQFNGTSSLVTINDAASLDLTTAMTLEAWVNPSVVSSAWRDVIYKGNDIYLLMGTTPNGGVPSLGGTFANSLFSPSSLALNTWTHLAGTYDGAMMRLYINGVQVASQAQTGNILTSTDPLQIGGDSLYGQYFQGMIDEVRVYNRALSQSEIQSDMNTPIGSVVSNTPPTISSLTNRTISEDTSTGTISFTVGDAETAAGSLTLSGTSSNPTLVPNANIVFGGSGATRTVALTPAANQSGTATITVTVSDGQANASTSFVLTVSAVNDAPTISSLANQTINAGANTGAIAFTVGDADTALSSLTLSGSSSNPTLVPNANIVFGGSGANRTVTVTPAAGQSGTATITVTVNDGLLSTSTSFVLTVLAVNTAPTISSIANRTINEDTSTGTISFTVGDAETAAGSLTLSKSSSNLTLVPNANIVFGGSGATRTVTVTPAANQSGTATITVTVSDGQLSANASFVLTVSAVNDSPTISSIANQTISAGGNTGAIAFTVGDVDTALSSLTLAGSSSNPTLVPNANIAFGGSGANRTVTVTPAAGQSGTATITVTVNDGQLSTSTSFDLTVTAVNTPPTISGLSDQVIVANTVTAPIAFTVSDAETSATNLTVSGSSSNPTLVPGANIVFGGSGSNRTVTVTPAVNQSGTATITVTVSDGSASASKSFLLTVNPATGAAFVYLPFEAESATLVSPMATASDPNAGQGQFISSATDNTGTATFTVTVPVSGDYVIWSRVLSPNSGQDSFFVSVDGGTEYLYATAQNAWTNAWQWTAVNSDGVGPVTFTLFAGTHTIVFRSREANTGLDQVLLTNDPNYVPDVIFSITAPPMRISSIAYDPAGFVTLAWPSVPGKTYRVSYKTSLSDSTWTPLGEDLTATDTTTSRSDYVVGNRFYSVQQLP
ncbi:MAG TPA: tandem-95 repeat protein [Haliangiales bacterium]|nr:tandem-95 repeat protein [Haliangiales bacterium]